MKKLAFKEPELPQAPQGLIALVSEKTIRLDQFLKESIPGHSRTFFQELIRKGAVTVNKIAAAKASYQLSGASTVEVQLPIIERYPLPKRSYQGPHVPIIYENSHFIIINKPAGLNVHPPMHTSDEPTVVEWLLTYRHTAQHVGTHGRQGIVHRLDKNTSGLMILALTLESHEALSKAFKDRTIKKEYAAIVRGSPPLTGTLSYCISRDPHNKVKMTHKLNSGRDALTTYMVKEYFSHHALIHAYPLTGRTHQIRVHFAALGNALEGDTLYGVHSKLINRHALHAQRLSFQLFGISYDFFSELPDDFKELITHITAP